LYFILILFLFTDFDQSEMVTEEVVSTETGNTPTPHQLDYSGNRKTPTQYSQTYIKRSLFGQRQKWSFKTGDLLKEVQFICNFL
jgi:hypothetical protein